MPSLLAKAAMMALGATGDRRLTGVSPCTHDSCGRRLVEYAADDGAPVLKPETSFAIGTDSSAKVNLWANGFEFANPVATGGHGSVTIDQGGGDDRIMVSVNIASGISHPDKNCGITVIPTAKYGATDLGANQIATSVTFGETAMSTFDHDNDNDANTPEQAHAQWSAASTGCTVMSFGGMEGEQGGAPGGAPEGGDGRRLEGIGSVTATHSVQDHPDCTCQEYALDPAGYPDATFAQAEANGHTYDGGKPGCVTTKPLPADKGTHQAYEVILDAPDIGENTLGFLGYELAIEIQCSQNDENDVPANQLIKKALYNGASNAHWNQAKPARVQFTYTEDSSDALKYSRHVSDLTGSYDYDNAAHASLPTSVTGTAWLQSSNVRFPAGQWDTFSPGGGGGGGGAPNALSKVTCDWVVDTTPLSTALGGSYTSWVNDAARTTGTSAFAYDTPSDVACDPPQTDISCGRKHTATIGWHTNLGIEAPLSTYFQGSVAPKITCTNDDAIANTQYVGDAQSKDAALAIDSTKKLGTVVAGLEFGLGIPDDTKTTNSDGDAVDDQGEVFFGEDTEKDIFGADSLFTVGAANPDDFQDLIDETYDYQFAVTFESSKNGAGQAGVLSTDTAKLANLLGAGSCSSSGAVGIACVQEILAGKLTTIQGSKVTRPTQYGDTTSNYVLTPGDGTVQQTSGITFRRNDDEISLSLAAAGDGEVEYTGSSKDNSGDGNIGFPGKDEEWVVDGVTRTTCVGCDSGFAADNAKLGTPVDGDGDGVFDVYEAAPAGLYDTTVYADCGAASPGKAMCKSDSDDNEKSFRCKEQSVSFTVDVRKAQEDDRVKQTQAVAKTYSVDDELTNDATIGTPVAAEDTDTYYVIAGAADSVAEHADNVGLSFAAAPAAGNGASLGDKTFSQTAVRSIAGYNAGGASKDVSYSFDFSPVCEAGAVAISHTRKYCSVYSDDHITPTGFAVEGDSQGHSGNKITEHKLREFGENIEFSFSPGTLLPLEAGNTQVRVQSTSLQGDGNAYDKTLATYASDDTHTAEELARAHADGGCWLQTAVGAGPKLHCAVLGFKATDYDSAGHLDNGDACGTGNLACPALSFSVSQAFVVPPHSGLGADAFEVASGKQQACGASPANRHDIGAGSVPVHVVGSDQAEDMYAQQLDLYDGWNTVTSGENNPVVGGDIGKSVGASTLLDSVGAHGEYQTTMALGDADAQADNFAEDSLADVLVTLTLHGRNVGTGAKASDVSYEVKNMDKSDYTLLHCHSWKGAGAADCITAINNGQTSDPLPDRLYAGELEDYGTGDTPTSRNAVLMLRNSVTGGDPCQGKARGAIAFGTTGARIGITRFESGVKVSETHVYTLPIRCHTELADTAIASITHTESTAAWFSQEITLQLTGSAVDKSKRIDLLSTLDQDSSVAGFQNVDGKTIIDSTDPADIGDDLTQVLIVHYNPYEQTQTLAAAAYVRKGAELAPVPAGSEITLQVPRNLLGFAGVADGAVYPLSGMTQFGDIIQLNGAKMKGRVGAAIGSAVTITASSGSGGEEVRMYDGTSAFIIPKKVDGTEDEADLVFEIVPDSSGEITCNFVTVELSSNTAEDESGNPSQSAQFTFQLPCPRSKYDAARSDRVHLDYELTAISFGATQSYITLPRTPDVAGLTSTAELGSCTNKELTGANGGQGGDCALTVGASDVQNVFQSGGSDMSASDVMSHFLTCGGGPITTEPATTGEFAGENMHVATVNVARAYEHTHDDTSIGFAVAKFCEEVQVKYAAVKSANKSATITVASSQDMDFEVHVSALAYADCTATVADGNGGTTTEAGVQLTATIDMSTKLATEAHNIDDLQTFYRNTDEHADGSGKYELSYTDSTLAALAGPQDPGDHQLNIVGECQSLSSGMFDENVVLDYRMVRVKNQVVYFAQASVELQISKPQEEQRQEMNFLASSLNIDVACAQSGGAINGGCAPIDDDGEPVPADFNAQITVSVQGDEATAFSHTCGFPEIRSGFVSAGGASSGDYELVSEIGEAFKANTDEGKQDLVGGENCEVTLGLANFDDKELEIQWTITRNTPTQRLRRLLTYTFGSDGSSAVTSTALTVAPAVRESEGAAVMSGDKIVEEITEDTVDGVTTRTTKVSDKSEISANGLEIASVAMGGVALLGVAVILIKGCAASKEKGITAVGTIATAQGQLWNRNRFAP